MNSTTPINLGELVRAKLARVDHERECKRSLQRWALSLLAVELERESAEGSTSAKHDLLRVVSMIDELK